MSPRRREHYKLTAHPLGFVMDAMLGKHLSARGFASPDIIRAWQSLIQPGLRQEARPLRLLSGSSPRQQSPRSTNKTTGSVLEVSCSEGAYLLLLYEKPQLIERLNHRLGYGAIRDIKLLKTPSLNRQANQRSQSNTNTDDQPPVRADPSSLDDALFRLNQARLSRQPPRS